MEGCGMRSFAPGQWPEFRRSDKTNLSRVKGYLRSLLGSYNGMDEDPGMFRTYAQNAVTCLLRLEGDYSNEIGFLNDVANSDRLETNTRDVVSGILKKVEFYTSDELKKLV